MNDDQNNESIGCIVGAIIQSKPECIHTVSEYVKAYDGVDIHAQDDCARLVITIEAKDSKGTLTITESLQNIHGVLSITPVYQYNEENQTEGEQRGWQWR